MAKHKSLKFNRTVTTTELNRIRHGGTTLQQSFHYNVDPHENLKSFTEVHCFGNDLVLMWSHVLYAELSYHGP